MCEAMKSQVRSGWPTVQYSDVWIVFGFIVVFLLWFAPSGAG